MNNVKYCEIQYLLDVLCVVLTLEGVVYINITA